MEEQGKDGYKAELATDGFDWNRRRRHSVVGGCKTELATVDLERLCKAVGGARVGRLNAGQLTDGRTVDRRLTGGASFLPPSPASYMNGEEVVLNLLSVDHEQCYVCVQLLQYFCGSAKKESVMCVCVFQGF